MAPDAVSESRRWFYAVRCRMPLTAEQALAVVRELLVPAHVNEHPLTKGVIASLDTGRTLFEHHPERRMSPASNSKLYVAALALDHFGGDYRIETPIFATAVSETKIHRRHRASVVTVRSASSYVPSTRLMAEPKRAMARSR